MEEVHHTHKEAAWGWAAALDNWRRRRTRARLRKPQGVLRPASR